VPQAAIVLYPVTDLSPMKNKCVRAEPFIATRNHHQSEMAEDYVEIVSDLISQKGKARTCDIAKLLGVSHVTVVRTIERLKKKGYIHSEQHQSITLTEEGAKLAAFSQERHRLLLDYLMALGVPESIAAIDVEGMEHHISSTTIAALQKHLTLLKE
jgi:DtxR family manganese transport transcriptional regulator